MEEDKDAEAKYIANILKFCDDFIIIGCYIILDSSRAFDWSKIIDKTPDTENKAFIVYDPTKSQIGYGGLNAFTFNKGVARKKTDVPFNAVFTQVPLDIKIGVLFKKMMKDNVKGNYVNTAACKQKKENALIGSLINYDKISNKVLEKQNKLLGNGNDAEYKNIAIPNFSEISTPLRTMNFLQKVLMYQQ